ncbi:MAG: hypothetical protein ACK5MA_04170 [Parachlamydiaceae bacterium]
MYKIIFYLCIVTGLLIGCGIATIYHEIPIWLEPFKHYLTCSFVGGLGGCTYCFRAIYLNKCVQKQWDLDWEIWYYLRPIVSIMCGAISCLFLQAGLLILEAGIRPNATETGFYALAFIAGLNPDKFLSRIEEVAQATWGIGKSRASLISTNEVANKEKSFSKEIT